MNKSLTTKISIIFGFTISIVTVLFLTFGYLQTDKILNDMEKIQLKSIDYLVGLYDRGSLPSDMRDYFKNFNMEILTDKNTKLNILTSGKIAFTRETKIGNFISYIYKNSLYLYMKDKSFGAIFESVGARNVNDPLWIGYFITMGLLISFYISVIKSLSPLKKLNKNIKQFASGNMDFIPPVIKGNDEIAQVAHEFDNAVLKIKELVKSRQLFLRTIMHELKTPISKGRIVSEMLSDELQKSRLVTIFERLEILINEFAKVEQLLSKSYALNYQSCHFSLILEQVKDILMLDDEWDEKVEVKIFDDALLRVDFQLFSLAIKNLIDNAIKYSDDKKCKIICDKNQICVSNKGNPLPISIEHYKQAFVRNKEEKASGMGLGMYIIDRICCMHKFKFDYCYSEKEHHFCIIFDDEILKQKSEKYEDC